MLARSTKEKPCPMSLNLTLAPYFQKGLMKWEGRELVGLASDGLWVAIGTEGEWKQIASYLAENPSPEDW